MIFTIVLIVICALILMSSVYFISKNKFAARPIQAGDQTRWRHNDGTSLKI